MDNSQRIEILTCLSTEMSSYYTYLVSHIYILNRFKIHFHCTTFPNILVTSLYSNVDIFGYQFVSFVIPFFEEAASVLQKYYSIYLAIILLSVIHIGNLFHEVSSSHECR
jgi:hypothetical protein